MNIFNKILADEHQDDTRLGFPARDKAHYDRRMNAMARLTGGRGFTTPKQEPKTHPTFGTTRGERKRQRAEEARRVEIDRQEDKALDLVADGLTKEEAFSRFGSLRA